MVAQTTTPLLACHTDQWKATLVKNMVGKKLDQLQRHSKKLSSVTTELNTKISSCKNSQGTRIQLEGAKTQAIVVSTMAEAQAMINSELTHSQLLQDVLLGFPITPDKFSEIFELSKKVTVFQIFIDNLSTLEALEAYYTTEYGENDDSHKMSVFLKVDCGYGRAGVPINDPETIELAKRLQKSPCVDFTGIYTHAGHSYSSENFNRGHLISSTTNVTWHVNFAIILFNTLSKLSRFPLAPHLLSKQSPLLCMRDYRYEKNLGCISEVHAGAFFIFGRQQVSTGLGDYNDVAITVACRIASVYKDRDSLLIDGGALAFSKDTAPQGGFGCEPKVIATLTKVSQEHGILQHLDESTLSRPELQIGKLIRVIPNHCCLTAACHLFYLIEDGGDTVVDVWVPVRGW
ncbi:putative serine dehydratase domain-containing protein [Mucor mucedo]|uniref:putative serine dehydratase domain-containing protein n=1 Tax=Mucor mucedo TaxID=29922 RepID=UPI002220329C|nr:putative serine dehydratase domain-containing protein [Mucor mucedo]KAI7890505.1 putative serine dehydratase domain-containing protein [Mucor mucedo]